CSGTPNGTCCLLDTDCDDFNSCTADVCIEPNAAALSFDGVDDRVDLGSAAAVTAFGSGSFTIEGWFLADTASTARTGLFRMGRQGANPQVALQLATTSPNTVSASVETNTASTQVDTVDVPFTLGQWHHVAAVADRTPGAQRLRLYLDGVLSADADANLWGANPISWNEPSVLGAARLDTGALGLFFDGSLDEVRIWSGARSLAEIQAAMNLQIEAAPNLVARWGMNEGPGNTTTADSVGSSLGALNGPAWVTVGLVDLGQGYCQEMPLTGPACDDGDACTANDSCSGGACAPGSPVTCDDSNPCTDEICESENGCIYTNNTVPCSDGNACTVGDTCGDGECAGGTVLSCDDSSLCTTDTCLPATGCSNTPVDCNDGNLCTDDSCTPAGGCGHANNTAPCSDGLLCTGPDICSGGVCGGALIPGCCLADADCADASSCTVDFCPTGANTAALRFDGVDDYVTMGAAPNLGAAQFTVEGWFMWEGGGVSTTTGAGGTDIFPLVTKGAPQAEGSNVDENYLLGIRSTGNPVLAADFEEGAGGASPGLNHPIAGTKIISQNVWHHAAVTYDGSCWKLYLDGAPDALIGTACPGQPPRADSIQHFGIAAALTSAGARNGAFKGRIDEVRIWSRALSSSEILAGMTRELSSGAGLIGRWGVNEGSGPTVGDSTSPAETGTLTNGPTWSGTGLIDFGSPNVCENDHIAGCCETAADCDDANACNGVESCVGGACQAGAAVVCGDTDKCTTDTCVPATGACDFAPIPGCCQADAQCDDANACTTGGCNTLTDAGVALDGTNDYVTMGTASALGTQTFTLEAWIRRTGAGAATSTGTGGIASLVPIVSKGRGEAETPANLNTNYIMGISGSILAADFEDKATGLNHPVCGSTTIPTDSSWHHVAAAYDGSCWSLYVDGVAQTLSTTCSSCAGAACTVCPGALPENTSIQHFGIGTAMTSAGTAAGFFMGTIDEVRVWNRALASSEIVATKNREVSSNADLLGRWGLNELLGTTAANSVPGRPAGTLTNGAAFTTTNLPPVGTDTCEQTPLANGSPCTDGDSCTQTDACQGGVCSGANPVVCTASDQCHVAGACNQASGLCSNPAAPDGTACDDGNSCSVGDTCNAAVCQAGAPRDDDGDTHGAAACGGDDCDDARSEVWATPDEVAEMYFSNATTLVWLPPTVMGGAAVSYDLLSSGDHTDFVTSALCVETSDGTDTTAIDAAIPAEGSAIYYLVRAGNTCPLGQGVLGRDSEGTPMPGRTCP
ncbi:MAG TPA: LamG-like jellyroll fold domain-containing protein, partial [Candidatus Polarisedimenticolia bacterium]|nr:LamG-like jellyroll fold domain-containing protein [Candidatus Polarisedimenticolia bacterium]